MVGITSGAIINCILDPLLITTFKMGIRGAAIATITGQFVSFILLLVGASKSDNVKISIKNFIPKKEYIIAIVNGGFPSLCRQGIASLGTIYLHHTAGFYGDFAITGMTVCSRVIMFFNSAMIGFGQGFQPVCGFNYGAKLYGRVLQGFWFCVRLGVVYLTICAILGYIFAEDVVALFRNDAEVVAVGASALRWQFIAFPISAFTTITNMMLQTIRKSVRATVLSSARQGLFYIPLIFILPHFFGLHGVEMCQAISDILTFFLAIPLVYNVIFKELVTSH
jgi:Na+-driven multidrug efflux pump